MRIAIDARWIYREISGIGAYTRALIREFSLMSLPHEFLLIFCDDELRERTVSDLDLDAVANMHCVTLPYSIFSLSNQFRLPGWLKREKIDLFHSSNYMVPLSAFPRGRRGRTACVVTVHDMIPMIYREQVAKSKKARMYPLFRFLLHQVAKRADAILTVSNSSARDIIALLNVPALQQGKVHTVYNGVDPMFSPPVNDANRFDRGSASERVLLYVGRADPYKNMETLVRAFAKARSRVACPLRLVIAGSEDPRYPEAGAICKQLGLDEAVRWTGYLDPQQLLELYRTADLLVHPSRYEGFGLQIVEAMACGTPVLSSNAASLPEVVGDAGIMVSADDEEGFADAIIRIVSDADLQLELSHKGLARAEFFSWRKAAEETVAVYEGVCD